MSQLSTATTVARRAPRGRAQAPQRELRVVTAAGAAGSPWFPVLVVGLLLAGLAGVLALNTTMAQDSFEVTRLEARAAELGDTREALAQDVNARSAPQNLARRARSLGMVPADSAAFVDLREGTVLGVAKAAEEPAGFSVDAASRPTGGGSSSDRSDAKTKDSTATDNASTDRAAKGGSTTKGTDGAATGAATEDASSR